LLSSTKAGHDQGASKEQIEQIQKPLAEQLAAQNALIANLTKALLEKNPAAGPGAQQAVGAAVGSIAKGAAEGDARLKQAFGFLEENKIAEATQLLNAVTEDKTARAGQETARAAKDRKEAAIAYRNLGAIADLADPKRALEAYEKAISLDPDDLVSLVWIGEIQIDHGDLNEAQTRLERVLTLAKTDDQGNYKYWALLGLGDIKQKRGDLAGALKSYQDGLAIAARLAKSEPGNVGWQRDLSMSYSRIGDVQVAQSDLAGALKSYNDSLAIIDRLAKSDPGNAGWQRDLSVSYEKIGDVQIAQGNLAGALKSYEAYLAITDRLAKSDPGNAGWQRDLAVSFDKLALAHKQSGDKAKALDFFRQGQAIVARLTKLSPDNAEWKQDLAWFDGQIAALAPLRLEHGRNPRTPLSRR
jgi:tetratricopeptide (TPR) repeat protein